MVKRIILFLTLNFIGLAIGAMYTESGVSSEWYQEMNKAPWTPPGWVFGVAWTFIMVCFAVFMAQLLELHIKKKLVLRLFVIQWVLNMVWNPIFFYLHAELFGLICIVLLTIVIAYFSFRYMRGLGWHTLWIAPYLIWLCIATSLNAYIVIYN